MEKAAEVALREMQSTRIVPDLISIENTPSKKENTGRVDLKRLLAQETTESVCKKQGGNARQRVFNSQTESRGVPETSALMGQRQVQHTLPSLTATSTENTTVEDRPLPLSEFTPSSMKTPIKKPGQPDDFHVEEKERRSQQTTKRRVVDTEDDTVVVSVRLVLLVNPLSNIVVDRLSRLKMLKVQWYEVERAHRMMNMVVTFADIFSVP